MRLHVTGPLVLTRPPLILMHSSLLNKHLAPSTHSFAFSVGHFAIVYKIYHNSIGQANDLPCSIVLQRPTATHNSTVPCIFQPLTTTLEANWKCGWGVVQESLSHMFQYLCMLGVLASKWSQWHLPVPGTGAKRDGTQTWQLLVSAMYSYIRQA